MNAQEKLEKVTSLFSNPRLDFCAKEEFDRLFAEAVKLAEELRVEKGESSMEAHQASMALEGLAMLRDARFPEGG